MTDYFRTGSLDSLEQNPSLSSEEKKQLSEFLGDKQPKQEIDIDWKVGIVVGNNYSHKSLHPIVEISVDGEKFEFDMERVATMRLALAKALQATDKYEKDE